jgi:ABC-type Fe3+ transport system permease subunit
MTSLQEASAVLFLALGGWESITNGIFAFYIAGSANEAAALGVILIAVAAVSVAIINRMAGTRRAASSAGWVRSCILHFGGEMWNATDSCA